MADTEALMNLLAQKNGAVSYFAQLIGSKSAAEVSVPASVRKDTA
jgi:hypothetical protein